MMCFTYARWGRNLRVTILVQNLHGSIVVQEYVALLWETWIPTQNYHFNLALAKWETCALKQYIFTSCYDVGHQRFACMVLEPCLNVILFSTQVFIQNESCVFHLKHVYRKSFTFEHAHICSAQKLTRSLWHCMVTNVT